jgi:BMFP domain-containing protein YqiC
LPSSLKFASILVLVFALAASGGRAQELPSEPAPSTVRVNERADPCVRFRTLPNFESSAIGCLAQGEEGEVIDTRLEWRKLELPDGRQGWVAAAYLAPSSPGQGDATATAPAGPEGGAGVAELESALAETRSENETLHGRVEEAETLVAELESALAETRSENHTLHGRVEEAEASVAELETALTETRSENETLRRRIEESEASLRQFREGAAVDSDTFNAERGELAERLEEAIGTQAALEARVAELEAERSALSAELETTRSRLIAAEEAAWAAMVASRGEESGSATGLPPADSQRAVPVEPLGWEPPAVPSAQPALERPSEPLSVASEPLIVESDLPVEKAPSDTDAAFAEVRNWAQAWADQRVDDYLSHYSSGFRAPGGMSLDDWQALRRTRILRPVWIEVDLGQTEVVEEEPGRIVMRFTQSYRSDSYGDEVIKRLEMVREVSGWKIVREEVED